jgi:hypothetical protein
VSNSKIVHFANSPASYAKQKNVPADKQGQFGYGDVWTWTALGADTKPQIQGKPGPLR